MGLIPMKASELGLGKEPVELSKAERVEFRGQQATELISCGAWDWLEQLVVDLVSLEVHELANGTKLFDPRMEDRMRGKIAGMESVVETVRSYKAANDRYQANLSQEPKDERTTEPIEY